MLIQFVNTLSKHYYRVLVKKLELPCHHASAYQTKEFSYFLHPTFLAHYHNFQKPTDDL